MASVLPGHNIPSLLHSMNDKLIHAAIYFVAAVLIYLGFIRYQFVNPISREALWFIVIGCTFFGGMLELVQNYVVPSRTGDWLDFLSNTCGSITGVLIMRISHRIKA
ncbi:MAG: VanZ family protein [Owenweeksia sp.]